MTTNLKLIFPILLIAAEMVAYLSNDMYLPALPDLMREFQIGANEAQLSLSSWFIGSMSMQLLVGPISDRIGRRPVLITGMLLFVFSTLLCALSYQFNTLILARFIQGSTVCFIIVAGYASIHELFNQKNAIHLLALMNSIIVLAPALGPFAGGLILTAAGWRWTFWPLFIIGLIILIFLVKWMPEPLPKEQRHPLKIRLLLRQYKSILSNLNFVLLLLSYDLIFCGFIAWLSAGPFLVINQFHYRPFVFGIFQILIFSFYILSNHLVKRMMERYGVSQLIKRGLALTFLGGSCATLSTLLFPSYLGGLIIGMMIYSFGFGFCSAPLHRINVEASPEPMGSRMAILSTCLGASGLVATLLVNLSYNGSLKMLAYILLVSSSSSIVAYTLKLRRSA